MVEDVITAQETADILGVTLNNLRQIQHRKTITWVSRSGRKVYYKREDVLAYKEKRDARQSK